MSEVHWGKCVSVLLDGDNTTWSEESALVVMSDEMYERVQENSKILRDLASRRENIPGEFKVFNSSDNLDLLLAISEIVHECDGKNINAKVASFDRIADIVKSAAKLDGE